MSRLFKGIVAATVLAASGIAAAAPAEARHRHGNGDAALVAGIVGLGVGAAIASDNGYNRSNYYAYDTGPAYYQPAAYGYGYGYNQPIYYANYGYDRRYYGRGHRRWDNRGYGYGRRDHYRGYRDHGWRNQGWRGDRGHGYRDHGRRYRDYRR